MIIENKDYILEQISKDSHFFDLTFPKVINKGKDNERTDLVLISYGLPFETSVQMYILDKLRDKEYTLKEYLKEYQKLLKNIIEEIIYEDK